MRTALDCYPCLVRQSLDASRMVSDDPAVHEQVVREMLAWTAQAGPNESPPALGQRLHRRLREVTGVGDAYRAEKDRHNRMVMRLLPELRERIEAAADPFGLAVTLAIAGNIIDLGVASEYDLEASIARVLKQPFAIDHLERMRSALGGAREILYLADNAGETVLDRLLIEFLEPPVTYVVKGGPAVNDATREDAVAAGLGEVCEIIDNGAATLGTLLDLCSPEMKRRFEAADLIIAKGMANYESLSGTRAGLYFLLQAKCAVIAEHLDVPDRSILVMEDRPG